MFCHLTNLSLIHSIHSGYISRAPLQVHYFSEALPTTARILCWSYTPKRKRQLRVKDLLKVPTYQLEWDSNLRPSGRTTEPPCPTIFHNDIWHCQTSAECTSGLCRGHYLYYAIVLL